MCVENELMCVALRDCGYKQQQKQTMRTLRDCEILNTLYFFKFNVLRQALAFVFD